MATYSFYLVGTKEAQRGQGVLVTLDQSDGSILADLEQISVGDICTITESGVTGTIARIDLAGLSFVMNPQDTTTNLSNSTPSNGILQENAQIDVTTT